MKGHHSPWIGAYGQPFIEAREQADIYRFMWRYNESCLCYLAYILFILKQSHPKCTLSTLFVCLVNTQTSLDLLRLLRSQAIERISYGRRQFDFGYF